MIPNKYWRLIPCHEQKLFHLRQFGQWRMEQPDFWSLFQHEPNEHITHQKTGNLRGKLAWLSRLTNRSLGINADLSWQTFRTLHAILPARCEYSMVHIWTRSEHTEYEALLQELTSPPPPPPPANNKQPLTPIRAESTAQTHQAAHTLLTLAAFTRCVGAIKWEWRWNPVASQLQSNLDFLCTFWNLFSLQFNVSKFPELLWRKINLQWVQMSAAGWVILKNHAVFRLINGVTSH